MSTRSPLNLALLLPLLFQGVAVAQNDPWGSVRSWSGTVTIEVTENKSGDQAAETMTYKATGPVTLTDEMMDDGNHVMWPMPGIETLSDPAKAATAYDQWQAHVVASSDGWRLNEAGGHENYKCTADDQQLSKVGLSVDPSTPTPSYVLMVTPPKPQFKCTGEWGGFTEHWLVVPETELRLSGPRGAPGPISGTKTFTDGASIIKVTFDLAPAK